MYCILQMDKHEHKRLIYVLKHNSFLLRDELRCSMRHKLVGYKVLIKCFHGKLNVSLFIS